MTLICHWFQEGKGVSFRVVGWKCCSDHRICFFNLLTKIINKNIFKKTLFNNSSKAWKIVNKTKILRKRDYIFLLFIFFSPVSVHVRRRHGYSASTHVHAASDWSKSDAIHNGGRLRLKYSSSQREARGKRLQNFLKVLKAFLKF